MIKTSYIKKIALFILAIFFVSLDRLLKQLALSSGSGVKRGLLGNFLSFNFTPNRYIAFSLPLAGDILTAFILLLLLLIGLFAVYSWFHKAGDRALALALTFLFFGGISNLVDRLKYAYVIDYLDLSYFTVFNLADVMIVGATIWILVITWKK